MGREALDAVKRYRGIWAVAVADGFSARTRAVIREAVVRALAHIRAETQGVEAALDGPDPEYAVYLLAHFLSFGFPSALRVLDEALRAVSRVA